MGRGGKVKTEVQYRIYNYLAKSAGNANVPSDYLIHRLALMVAAGEATMADMRAAGGEWLVSAVRKEMR